MPQLAPCLVQCADWHSARIGYLTTTSYTFSSRLLVPGTLILWLAGPGGHGIFILPQCTKVGATWLGIAPTAMRIAVELHVLAVGHPSAFVGGNVCLVV